MRPLLIGCTVYGQRYLHSFLNYTWPSLLSEGNFSALSKVREVRLLIHTDQITAPYLSEKGFTCVADIMEGDKYEQLGYNQRMDLCIAKEKGADYHLLLPDFVYSGDFFTGMLKASEKHKAITRLVVSTCQEKIWPHLKVGMTAEELATLSLKYIHPGVKHWLMPEEGLPNTHVLAWETVDTLRMCSPHQTVVYIANEVINLADSNLPLDCILDKIIEGDIYCTRPEDGMVIIELSPKDSRKLNDKVIDLPEFARIFKWDTKNSQKQFEIFQKETVDPVNRKALGGQYWNDLEISRQKAIVCDEIRRSYAVA